jgi:oxaloacetate decarboxylase alpha subunit
MTEIRLVDTTVRDGNQSLWGATGLTTPAVLAAAPAMERAGFEAIDFTTSTHMAISVRFHHEDPFERIRLMRQATPTTPLTFLTNGIRFVRWERSPESVMRLGLRLVIRHGIRRVQIAEPMNDVEVALEVARIARAEGAEQIVAALTFTISPLHDDAFYVGRATALAASPLVDRLYVKDPGGLLTPERVRTLLPAMCEAAAGKLVEVHSHCTTSLAPVCYAEAARLGAAALHTAVTPLANGTSQPSTERTIANLRGLGFTCTVEEHAVREMSAHFDEVRRRQNLPAGTPVEYDVSYYDHQVPGGMMTTLTRQLAEVGLQDRLPEVLEEVPRVRAELGYPIMVTPFSQFVGIQAMLNVTSGRSRYEVVPDEVVRYVLGHFGDPPRPVDEQVRDRVLGTRRARELDRPRPEPSLADLRRAAGPGMTDEEVLLRTVLNKEQVDAIRPLPADALGGVETPLKTLLRELARRPEITSFAVSRDGFRLALSKRPEAR